MKSQVLKKTVKEENGDAYSQWMWYGKTESQVIKEVAHGAPTWLPCNG